LDITSLPPHIRTKFDSISLINYGILRQDAELNFSIILDSTANTINCVSIIRNNGFRILSVRDKDNNLIDIQGAPSQLADARRLLVRGRADGIRDILLLDCIERIEIPSSIAPGSFESP
jgi:hypothetical protein